MQKRMHRILGRGRGGSSDERRFTFPTKVTRKENNPSISDLRTKSQKNDIILKCSDGTLIERVQKMKYLSIIVDDSLRLGDHCDYMLKKIKK